MRKFILFNFLALTVLLLMATNATAQSTIFNGDFETGSYSPMWTLTGNNAATIISTFATVKGQPSSLCLRRMPGTPSNNGGLEQKVFLVGGVKYNCTVNAAVYKSG